MDDERALLSIRILLDLGIGQHLVEYEFGSTHVSLDREENHRVDDMGDLLGVYVGAQSYLKVLLEIGDLVFSTFWAPVRIA